MEDEKVFYNYVTGWPEDVVSTVLRKVSAYSRETKVKLFKIGISNNPERRFDEEHKYNFDEMIVIYCSDSYANVCELERKLIDHNRDLANNMIGGGGGRKSNPPYYMYIVLKHRKRK